MDKDLETKMKLLVALVVVGSLLDIGIGIVLYHFFG